MQTSFYGEANVYFRESVLMQLLLFSVGLSVVVVMVCVLCEYRVNQLENETPVHDPIITQNQSRKASKPLAVCGTKDRTRVPRQAECGVKNDSLIS